VLIFPFKSKNDINYQETMAVSEESGRAVQNNGEIRGVHELRRLPQEVCKQTLDDWKDSATEYVRGKLFDKKQFVTDEELAMGGPIQKLVCNDIKICGGERARVF
jgi:viroplasmin and RNaseH domain-containing protein